MITESDMDSISKLTTFAVSPSLYEKITGEKLSWLEYRQSPIISLRLTPRLNCKDIDRIKEE